MTQTLTELHLTITAVILYWIISPVNGISKITKKIIKKLKIKSEISLLLLTGFLFGLIYYFLIKLVLNPVYAKLNLVSPFTVGAVVNPTCTGTATTAVSGESDCATLFADDALSGSCPEGCTYTSTTVPHTPARHEDWEHELLYNINTGVAYQDSEHGMRAYYGTITDFCKYDRNKSLAKEIYNENRRITGGDGIDLTVGTNGELDPSQEELIDDSGVAVRDADGQVIHKSQRQVLIDDHRSNWCDCINSHHSGCSDEDILNKLKERASDAGQKAPNNIEDALTSAQLTRDTFVCAPDLDLSHCTISMMAQLPALSRKLRDADLTDPVAGTDTLTEARNSFEQPYTWMKGTPRVVGGNGYWSCVANRQKHTDQPHKMQFDGDWWDHDPHSTLEREVCTRNLEPVMMYSEGVQNSLDSLQNMLSTGLLDQATFEMMRNSVLSSSGYSTTAPAPATTPATSDDPIR